MSPHDFDFLAQMLKERSGLDLSRDKVYLLESRLGPLAKKEQLASIDQLVLALRRPGSEPLRAAATEAMTINESLFFRDKTPFQHFEQVMVPHLLKARAGKRSIRIWCAAASTGQEPYSLAIQTKEMSDKLGSWQVDIMATDICGEVLEKAKAGLYSQFEVQRGLPIQMLVKYFKQINTMWQIDAGLRALINFREFNLLDSYRALGQLDIVFCRNVLIYFDQPTKRDVLGRIAAQLAPDGFLLLGAAETVLGTSDEFVPVPGKRGLYMRKGAAQLAAPEGPASAAPAGTVTRPSALRQTRVA